MRLAITFAQNDKGQWHVLATPEMEAAKQLAIVKDIKRNGTYEYKGKQQIAAKAYCLSSNGAIRRYDKIKSFNLDSIEEDKAESGIDVIGS